MVPAARAALIYRAGEGWVSDQADSGGAEKTASAQFQKAQDLVAQREYKKAINAYRVLLKKFPGTGVSSKAQFSIGKLFETIKEPERAFDAYGVYLTKYPKGDDFDACVEAQFNIGKLFLNGERRKLFGMKAFPSRERAQQMFEDIVKNAPYSRFASMAQFNAGQAMEKQDKYPEAITAYQLVVEKYPADQIAGDAQYQIGYLYLRGARTGSNDRAAQQKARDAFEDFIIKYPQSEKIGQAKENLTTIASAGVKHSLEVAQFYEKTHNLKAAVVYYQEVVRNGPGTPEAATAQRQLEHLQPKGSEKAAAAKAPVQRKLQAQEDTALRPDFTGPPAPPVPEDESARKRKSRAAGETGSLLQPFSTAPDAASPTTPQPEPPLPTH